MSEKAKREKKDIIIAENRAFEGVWIPKRLYITNKFNLRTKFFVVEIKSLSKKGYCYATDKHFAEFLGVSDRMVQIMIKDLKDDGYLTAEYEYEKDTKGIKRRFLILTQKFLDEFYNEEEVKPTEKDFNTPTEENFNEPTETNFDTGTEKNCGGKYNNKINNNSNSSNTDSSITDKGQNINKVNGEVKTFFSENRKKMSAPKTAKQKYLDKKAEEVDMLNRAWNICNENYDEETANEIFNTLEHYFKRFTEKTGRIHPILKDKTLFEITDKMNTYYDTEYSHFSNLAEQPGAFIKMVDMFFDGDFGSVKGYETNWNLPVFMSDGILNRLGQRLYEAGEIY